MLTAERLREVLHYDPETGVFTWKVGRRGHAAGRSAGCVNGAGYRCITIDGTIYLAHRLVWLYSRGEWPTTEIDHRDGDPSNNRADNLRPSTHAQNLRNARRRSDNRSGFKGVSYDERLRQWYARIKRDGRQMYLGHFRTPEAAHVAYTSAASKLFGEFARPN